LPLSGIDVYENRSDPRDARQKSGTGRAYALGLGIRGRTAIRSVDEGLWTAVRDRGFECERFRLHFNSKFGIKLRDAEDGVEPSVLIYQTDLCAALLDELDRRQIGNVRVYFDSRIADVDLASSTISLADDGAGGVVSDVQRGPYDLIVGCDGANSVVRNALRAHSPPNTFSFTQRKLLPGCFKVARAEEFPPLLDPASVALILPEKNSLGITAFVEPTIGGGACLLFAGRLTDAGNETTTTAKPPDIDGKAADLCPILFPRTDATVGGVATRSSSDVDTIAKLVVDQFPLLEGTTGLDGVVLQLLTQRTSVADSVRCNVYNSGPDAPTPAAICGDAAHATGGVSGQGANSALVDSAALADCLVRCYAPADADCPGDAKRAMLYRSVHSYSQRMVPEGLALYDLSFGNDGKTLPIFRNVQSMLSNALDGVFGGRFGIGKKPLQTLLASSLTSFVDIRRDRKDMYVDDFPSDEAFRLELDRVYSGGGGE
jgi:kynurenine 3-monooxygenase